MRLPMTFKELLQKYDEDEIFPLDIDDPTRETIKNWFNFRRLCDLRPERFIVYFQRALLENYLRYRELLRIEPGVSKFDWLVESYKEMQNQRIVTDTKTGETTETTSETGTKTGDNTDTLTFNTTNARTIAGTKSIDRTLSDDGSKTCGGSDTFNNERTVTGTDIDTQEYDSSNTLTRTGTASRVYDNLKDTTTYNSTHSTVTSGSQTNENVNVVSNLVKSTPMSATYSTDRTSTGNLITGVSLQGQKISDLDYKALDSQTSADSRTAQKTTFDNVKDKLDDTGHDDTVRTGGYTDTPDLTDTQTKAGEDTLTKTKNDTIIDSGSKGYGKTETTSKDVTDNTDITDNKSDSTAKTGTETTVHEIDENTTKTGESSTVIDDEKHKDDLTRMRLTGRDTEIAKLLKSASQYIQITDSWKFLKDKLEPCFYGTYVEEDLEDEY